jgi:hypothetical protein
MSWKWIYIILCIILAACYEGKAPLAEPITLTPLIRASGIPSKSPSPSIEPISKNTSTPRPTRTSIPTKTMTPSPIPTQSVTWADWPIPPISLEAFLGTWSPAFDELLSSYPESTELGWPIGEKTAGVAIASSPDFKIHPIDLGAMKFYYWTFEWSPDGRKILFGGPSQEGDEEAIGDDTYIWIMDRKGENAFKLDETRGYPYHWLDFLGWMDETMIVITEYAGGDNYNMDMINILNGGIEGSVDTLYGDFFQPNKTFVPAIVDNNGHYRLILIKRGVHAEMTFWFDEENPGPLPSEPVLWIDADESTSFKDWRPGFDQMLAYSFTQNFEVEDSHAPIEKQLIASQLLLWDIDKNAVLPLAPDGVDGLFSPDGRTLAVVTIGRAELNTDDTFTMHPSGPYPEDVKTYLYIIETDNSQVSLGLPVIVTRGCEIEPCRDYPNFKTRMSFSPGSRYLAFLSPGKVVLDENGKLSRFEELDGLIYFNIVDIKTKQFVYSAPSSDAIPLWSPNSDRLVYRDENFNWELLDITDDKSSPLTLSGGENARDPAWSHDGRYLSLQVSINTIIFQVIP